MYAVLWGTFWSPLFVGGGEGCFFVLVCIVAFYYFLFGDKIARAQSPCRPDERSRRSSATRATTSTLLGRVFSLGAHVSSSDPPLLFIIVTGVLSH